MPPKKIRTRAIERSKYVIYLKKAQDFYRTMQLALGKGNWNSAGLEAVHCAISATDAILKFRLAYSPQRIVDVGKPPTGNTTPYHIWCLNPMCGANPPLSNKS